MHLTDAPTPTPTTRPPAPYIPPLDIAMEAARQTIADIDRAGYAADIITALRLMHGAAVTLHMLRDAVVADIASAEASDRPPLPARPTPHERDGRQPVPQPARPHPGVAA